jgi:hypothetical protein
MNKASVVIPDAKSTIKPLLEFVVFALVFFVTLHTPNDTDMWWHLRDGQEMMRVGKILTTDVFSYTRFDQPWTNAFWLSDLGMFGVFSVGGFLALAIAGSLLAVLSMWIVYKQMDGPALITLGTVLLSSFATSPVWSARPQMLSFFLLAVLDLGLSHARSPLRGRPWLLAPFFILWANIHGGFIWGFLLILATLVGTLLNWLFSIEARLSAEEFKDLTIWSIIAAGAVCINPNGLLLWRLPFYQIQVSFTNIAEWASPNFHRFYLHPILWLLFLLIIGVAFARQTVHWEDLLKALGFAYMAFVSQRNIGPYAIIIAPIVGTYLSRAAKELARSLQRSGPPVTLDRTDVLPRAVTAVLNFMIVALLCSVCLARAYWLSLPAQVYAAYPREAVEWIKQNHPAGKLLNAYEWGGYLTFVLPEYPVFIDGRADLYGDAFMGSYANLLAAPAGWETELHKYNVGCLLLPPATPLALAAEQSSAWQVAYQDATAVVVVRR